MAKQALDEILRYSLWGSDEWIGIKKDEEHFKRLLLHIRKIAEKELKQYAEA